MEILEFKDSKVLITPEGSRLPEYKALITLYRKDVLGLEALLEYVWYMHNPQSSLKNLSPGERQTYITEKMFDNRYRFSHLEQTKKEVSAFINLYLKTQSSFVRRSYEQVKSDIENLIAHVSSIPFNKVIHKTNVRVEFEHEGQKKEAYINTDIVIDNSEEKAKALKLFDTLLDLEAKLKQKVVLEDIRDERDESRSMIEQMQE